MKRTFLLPLIFSITSLLRTLAADPDNASAKTAAYQNSVSQNELRNQTRRVKEQLLALIDEYAQNPAAAAEVSQSRQAVEKLDTLSEKDMLAVVQALQDASRADGDVKLKIAAAGRGQKDILTVLQSLSDSLARHRDEASMEQRLRDLLLRQTTNLRETNALAASSVSGHLPGGLVAHARVCQSEQDALKNEIGLVLDTLQRIVSGPADMPMQTFSAVLGQGKNSRIMDQAAAASASLAGKDFAGSTANETQVQASLQGMIDALTKNEEQSEKLQGLATKMKELASTQKQLASTTLKTLDFGARDELREKQENIADKVAAVQKELSELDSQSGSQASQEQQDAEKTAEKLVGRDALADVSKRSDIVTNQTSIATSLADMSDKLQKKADAASAAENPGAGDATAQSSEGAQQALADAAQQLADAQNQIGLANRGMGEKGDPTAVATQIAAAEKALGTASDAVSKAGSDAGASPHFGKEIGAAQGSLSTAGANIAADAKAGKWGMDAQTRERNGWGLDRAREATARAQAALQEAQDRLTGQSGSEAGNVTGADGPGASGGGGGGRGGPATATSIRVTAALTPEERAALSALEREKAPTEYNGMIRQYQKNLADGEMPGVPTP